MRDDSTVGYGRTFLVTDREGRPSRPHDGFYHDDTRHLRRYGLTTPRSVETLNLVHPRPGRRVVHAGGEFEAGSRPVHVTRRQAVTDLLAERIEVGNLGREPIEETLRLELATGFRDIFEIRGRGGGPDREIRAEPTGRGVTFRYDPPDVEYERSTTVRMEGGDEFDADVSSGPADAATLTATLRIQPGATGAAAVYVSPTEPDASNARYEALAERLREREQEWESRTSLPPTHRSAAETVVERSRRDLLSLTMDTAHGPMFVAGTPWYATAFGRDSLIAAYQALPLTTAPAEATVRFLAERQATATDEFRAAAPGKILHELRDGELTTRGVTPHSPYYGTVDATALFVVLLHEVWRRTGDDALLDDLEPNLDAALNWFEAHGDADGDGFLDYPTEGDGELTHRAWRDSEDGIVRPDGSDPPGPLAVAEAQGYHYDALVRAAELYRHRGDAERADALEGRAADLAARFDEAFWTPDESFYAVALDGDGRRVESVTTNPGHCLWSGIVPPDRADRVVDRLVSDDVFSGWGLRTLSRAHDAYNPQSYHLGSVWPHDTSLAALGMTNYGRRDAARTVTDGLIDAATRRDGNRLPELFAGFDRGRTSVPVEYGVACEPQAWAAAAPVACLGALGGDYDLNHVGAEPSGDGR